MRRRTVLVTCLGLLALAGCADATPTAAAGDPPSPSAGPSRAAGPSGATPDAAPTAALVPFSLYTHCGIHEVRFGDRWFTRVGGPLTDGSGNPPAGWGTPEQRGYLTVDGDTAVFTDDLGHHEEFRVREGATDFLTVCA